MISKTLFCLTFFNPISKIFPIKEPLGFCQVCVVLESFNLLKDFV